jgi:conjugal transfer pilus assembly protein TraW
MSPMNVSWARRMGSSKAFRILAVAAGLAAAMPAWPEDLGRVGPVYPVAEPDLLELIEARLKAKQKSGELARIEREFLLRSRQAIESPRPVEGLVRTRMPRTFYYDPSVTVPDAVRDHEGRVLVAAGTRVNPLDYVSLSNHLVFFDARDRAQTRKALDLYRQYQGRVRLILVGGSYIDFMKRHDMRVYYDQHGLLVQRLGIRQVPALVSQEGKRLRIDELNA